MTRTHSQGKSDHYRLASRRGTFSLTHLTWGTWQLWLTGGHWQNSSFDRLRKKMDWSVNTLYLFHSFAYSLPPTKESFARKLCTEIYLVIPYLVSLVRTHQSEEVLPLGPPRFWDNCTQIHPTGCQRMIIRVVTFHRCPLSVICLDSRLFPVSIQNQSVRLVPITIIHSWLALLVSLQWTAYCNSVVRPEIIGIWYGTPYLQAWKTWKSIPANHIVPDDKNYLRF